MKSRNPIPRFVFDASLSGFFALIILLAAWPSDAFSQSGWTRARGGIFLKADWSLLSAAQYATPEADLVDTEKYIQVNLNLYGEYGITDRLTAILQGPLVRSHRFFRTESAVGPGDLRVDLKYRLTSNELPVALSIGAEIPTGNPDKTAPEKDFPMIRAVLPTGDGEWNFWGTVAASKGWRKTYLSAFGAINLRTKNDLFEFVNLYQAGLEFGFHPAGPVWLNLKVRSQFRDAPGHTPQVYFLYGDGTTYTITALEGYFALTDHWGATLTFLSGSDFPVKMRNLYLAPMVSVGVIYRQGE